MERMVTSGKNLTKKLDPSVLPRDAFLVWESLYSFIHSFIHFIFAFNKKYNNSIQKYIKDNIRTIFQLNYYKIKCGKGKEAYIEAHSAGFIFWLFIYI